MRLLVVDALNPQDTKVSAVRAFNLSSQKKRLGKRSPEETSTEWNKTLQKIISAIRKRPVKHSCDAFLTSVHVQQLLSGCVLFFLFLFFFKEHLDTRAVSPVANNCCSPETKCCLEETLQLFNTTLSGDSLALNNSHPSTPLKCWQPFRNAPSVLC